MKVAVLLACHNRREQTRACLGKLLEEQLPEKLSMEVFICDDGSSDGTTEMLQTDFPQVHSTLGDGSLFWGGGMRKAWELAQKKGHFDFFLWLNDDTVLLDHALMDLFLEYELLGKAAILSAACKDPLTQKITYGGSNESGMIVPNGSLQSVKWINGNLVLIPQEIVAKIGILSKDFTHNYGDMDYGLRAQSAGYTCYTSSKFLADCPPNLMAYWGNAALPFKKRWQMLHHIKGLALSEYTLYLKRHEGTQKAIKNLISSYFRVFFPGAYPGFRKKYQRVLKTIAIL